jgi:multiple sugar transport system permease protein
MPIISQIGRRNWKVRVVVSTIYTILIIGSISMIYPLLLMLSGSVKSDTDFIWITPVPRYLWNDDILWMKYGETKYPDLITAEQCWAQRIGSWRNVQVPDAAELNDPLVDAFRQYRAEGNWPDEFATIGFAQWETQINNNILAKNARLYRREAQKRYDSVEDYSNAVGFRCLTWSQAGPPSATYAERYFTFPDTADRRLYHDIKNRIPKADWAVVNIDGHFVNTYLMPVWADVAAYNRDHGTSFTDYRQVLLDTRPPVHPQQRSDWEDYVRNQLNVAYLRISTSAQPAFQSMLRQRYSGDINQLNRFWSTTYTDFSEIPLPQGCPKAPRAQTDYIEFIKDAGACPLDAMSIYGPRQGFEQYVADQRGLTVADVAPLPLPIIAVDYRDMQEQKSSFRWELLKRNYLAVFDYILLHGNGVRNTIIFCTLMVLTQLIVNPLAAYALSRYRPPSTYTILLFCMCTMAFPAEVTMIPSFLLLKSFPIYSLAVGFAAGLLTVWLLHRLRPQLPDWAKGIAAGAAGIAAGYWLAPFLCHLLLGKQDAGITLLNTFWALILPGVANGFAIFLLKGFFDSLPQELYEAAEIDGAGEWTKFWTITMSLSKPILAVLALGAFTAAYSEFMMALVIIPDPEMWTMMVWLFQLQNTAHPTVVYASLVVAAIPTLLIFIFCQNIIMRGIVVPVEK